MKKTIFLCGLALLAGCGGSDTLTPQEQQLTVARTNWRARGLRSYKFTIRRNAFIVPEAAGPVTITVRDGVATDSPDAFKPYDTIEKLHDIVGNALTNNAAQVDLDFASDGWPNSFYIDPVRQLADDEFGIVVSALTPL